MCFIRKENTLILDFTSFVNSSNGDIFLKFCGSKSQLADIFTKPLGRDVFQFQRQSLGIINNVILEIKREC
jgi:hypothetical protein